MSTTALLLLLCNLTFDTAGHLSFKAAAEHERHLTGIAHWKAMLTDKWIWLGALAFVCELLCWLAFLSVVPLSTGVLVGCISIVTIMIGGRVFFGEMLTRKRLLAAGMIAVGVLLVGVG